MFTAALGGRLLQICANTDFVLIASSRYVMSWSISPVTVQCDLPSAASATDPGLGKPGRVVVHSVEGTLGKSLLHEC